MINIFLKYKSIFYLSNFFLIFYYLYPDSILGCIIYDDCKLQPYFTPSLIFSDVGVSFNHLVALLSLSLVGFLTYRKTNNLKKLYIYLLFLSICLEVAHYYIPERSFEFPDLFGNLIGVIIMILFSYLFKKYENSEY